MYLSLEPLHLFSPTCIEAEGLTTTRLDVELALQTGLPTLFHSNAVVPANCILGNAYIIEEQLLSTTSRLSSIMLGVVNFANLLNGREREGQPKLDPLTYTETLVSLLYRLIEIAPLGQLRFMSRSPYDDVRQIAMLVFMTTLLPKYVRDESSHLLSDRLESAVQDLHATFADTQDSGTSLLLWSLFIGGVSDLNFTDHWWLILETCERLDLSDWQAVRRQLCEFPWIHALHDGLGQDLWGDAQRRNNKKP